MEFKDNRSKRIIFLGNCILNQNARFQGIAVKKGSITEFVDIILQNDIGIEQLPCLECLDWGGVSRKIYYRFQPLIFRFIDSKLFPVIKIFYHIWILKFSRFCKKEADKIVKRIQDYQESGYEIVGIVTANDSPTCGVTNTMDLLEAAKGFKSLGFKTEDLYYPQLEKMRDVVPTFGIEGSGLFIKPLRAKLEKRNINVQIVGFDPWVQSFEDEALRVTGLLGI